MFKEFKEFALKGNALELAVGVVIGTAFQTIVKSLVNDIIMPLFSALIGNVDYSEWTWTIGNTTIPYGSFISAIINFLLIAFSLFLVVRYINKINKQIEEAKKENAEKIEKSKMERAKKIEELRKKNKLFDMFSKTFSSEEKQEEVQETEATTKLCPYCLSEIHIKAIRCPHCTSKLEE